MWFVCVCVCVCVISQEKTSQSDRLAPLRHVHKSIPPLKKREKADTTSGCVCVCVCVYTYEKEGEYIKKWTEEEERAGAGHEVARSSLPSLLPLSPLRYGRRKREGREGDRKRERKREEEQDENKTWMCMEFLGFISYY